MKQIYWIVILLCSSLATGCVTHQQNRTPKTTSYSHCNISPYWSNDSILLFPKAEIIDSSIIAVFDSIININSQSRHHQYGEKTWFNITEEHAGDTIIIAVYSEQYDGMLLNPLSNQISYGVFYYKGFLFDRRKIELENSVFFKIVSDSIPIQHYYSNAKIYKCAIKGNRYPDYEKSVVEAMFVNGKLLRMDCKTYCPRKSWVILFDSQ